MATVPSPIYQHRAVMERLAQVAGLESDAAIAAELGVSPPSFASWKSRGSVPYERICEFALRRNISLDWLFLGAGAPGPIGNPVDAGIFGDSFRALFNELEKIAKGDRFPWPYLIANVVGIYNDAARSAVPNSVATIVGAESRVRAAAFAHATASLLRQQNPTESAEIQRIEKIAAALEAEARDLRARALSKAGSPSPVTGRRKRG